MPQYSIIIPVYNSELSLEICITSIQNQKVRDCEIIVVDDGSSDRSCSIIEELAKEDERIKLIKKTNGGAASARNVGLEIARGDYILFVDSDDYLDSRYLETYDDLLRIYPNALVYQSFVSQYKDKTIPEVLPNQLYTKEDIPDCLILLETQRCLGGACNKIFSAKVIKDNVIRFNEQLHYGEDKIFTLQYLQFVDQIFLSDNCYYFYNRTTTDSLSKKHHKSNELSLFAELEYELFLNCLDRFPNDRLKDVINTRYSSLRKYVLLSMYRPGDSASYEEKKSLRNQIKAFDENNTLLPEYNVEIPPLINKIYKYEFLMFLTMFIRTKFSMIYNLIRY